MRRVNRFLPPCAVKITIYEHNPTSLPMRQWNHWIPEGNFDFRRPPQVSDDPGGQLGRSPPIVLMQICIDLSGWIGPRKGVTVWLMPLPPNMPHCRPSSPTPHLAPPEPSRGNKSCTSITSRRLSEAHRGNTHLLPASVGFRTVISSGKFDFSKGNRVMFLCHIRHSKAWEILTSEYHMA